MIRVDPHLVPTRQQRFGSCVEIVELRIGTDDLLGTPTTAEHNLLIVAKYISWPNETFLHVVKLPIDAHRRRQRTPLRRSRDE